MEIFTVKTQNLTLLGDMLLADNHLLLLSCYGSEQQLRGLFATVGQWEDVKIQTPDWSFKISRSYNPIGLKLLKVGFAKLHGIIYASDLSDYLIVFPGETLTDAYKRFLHNRKIPMLKQWLTKFHELALKEGIMQYIPRQINIEGYKVNADDDAICDFIVKNLDQLVDKELTQQKHHSQLPKGQLKLIA